MIQIVATLWHTKLPQRVAASVAAVEVSMQLLNAVGGCVDVLTMGGKWAECDGSTNTICQTNTWIRWCGFYTRPQRNTSILAKLSVSIGGVAHHKILCLPQFWCGLPKFLKARKSLWFMNEYCAVSYDQL